MSPGSVPVDSVWAPAVFGAPPPNENQPEPIRQACRIAVSSSFGFAQDACARRPRTTPDRVLGEFVGTSPLLRVHSRVQHFIHFDRRLQE
jgi:hypothetical protein